MSQTPYIEMSEFKNDWQPAYPTKMWQVIERDYLGDIINARAVSTKEEAETIKYQFQKNQG